MPVELQIAQHDSVNIAPDLADVARLNSWLSAIDPKLDRLVYVRICDEAESAALNQQFRNKDNPTNVLSFPAQLDELDDVVIDDVLPLGDLVICWPVVCTEAAEQGKPIEYHLAHLFVHGVLHLMGYDHLEEQDAHAMESLEVSILSQLGIDNPYEPCQ